MESAGKTRIAMPIGECVPVTSLAHYQQSSVVSRALYANDAGTVTLFAFSEGQGLSEHTAPFDALVEILEGEAQIVIAGKALLAKAGELILMPAHQPHALQAITRFKMLLTMLRAK